MNMKKETIKKELLLILFIVLVTAAYALAQDDAVITYTTENQAAGLPIVPGVPFIIHANMQITPATANVKSLKLYTKSTGGVTLLSGNYRGPGTWLSSITPDDDGPVSSTLWLYALSPTGDVESSATVKRITNIRASAASSGTVDVDSSAQNEIGKAPSGTFSLTSTALSVSPTTTRCGDGVIDFSAGEICDDQGAANGCSNTCTYVELRYSCSNTGILQNLKSTCTRLEAKAYLVAKLTALFNAQCYPLTTPICTHPQVLYNATNKDATNSVPRIAYDSDKKLSLDEKIYLVAQVSAALREFLAEVT